MSDSQNTPRSGFTVDLSSGSGPAKTARPKGFAPVVQQTIDLTTRKAETPRTPETPSASAAGAPRRSGPQNAPSGNRRREAPRDERASGGTSLADLLDEATLARLRGGA